MTKKSKKVLTISIICLIVIIVILAFYPVRFLMEARNMSPLETGEIIPGVYALKDSFVNMYLLKEKDNYVAIDAGNKITAIKQELIKMHIDPEKVSAVFLTHTDSDHAGCLGLFSKAQVYISDREVKMIDGTTKRFFVFKNKINHKYNIIKDGDVISIAGLTIKGILTPGHTPGSMCYIINNKYIFTGDNLRLISGKVNLFFHLFNMDSRIQLKSLKKLSGIKGVKYIFTAHSGYSDDFEEAFKNFGSGSL